MMNPVDISFIIYLFHIYTILSRKYSKIVRNTINQIILFVMAIGIMFSTYLLTDKLTRVSYR